MTNEQINIKIAELCGWTPAEEQEIRARAGNAAWLLQKGPWWRNAAEKTVATVDQLPNYAADLNACHEAETAKEMHFDQRWIEAIVEVALREFGHTIERTDGWDWVALVARLSARQRCEAFLRVHNQWEEQP